jgi:serine kinase of HPr protein (carbohydrate metabolism regulator)
MAIYPGWIRKEKQRKLAGKKLSSPHIIYATCVAIASQGVLLLGKSGAGKSDLALRLIDRGASLVSDDQVCLQKKGNMIIANAPAAIKGLLEIRGIGILKFSRKSNIALQFVVELVERKNVERLPEPEFYQCLGIEIPKIKLYAFDASAAIKIETALKFLKS